mmetsp:Transcript_18222/g.57269  ORF Transcript_18222/g.57269 Transcript_18222/m.57269 type:complete len:210 (+) Transcript_18222:970-1599(+)
MPQAAATSIASASVGILKGPPPSHSRRSSSSPLDATLEAAGARATRAGDSSWTSTTSPSADTCRSTSASCAPSSAHAAIAPSEFSGNRSWHPRCAATSTASRSNEFCSSNARTVYACRSAAARDTASRLPFTTAWLSGLTLEKIEATTKRKEKATRAKNTFVVHPSSRGRCRFFSSSSITAATAHDPPPPSTPRRRRASARPPHCCCDS